MINNTSIVETSRIGNNVTVEEYVIIRKDAVIGDNVIIHPFVVINEGVVIGNNVEIFPHAFLGKEPKGSGLARKPVFEKECTIGEFSVIGPHAIIYYGTSVGRNNLISEGVSVRENCTLGDNVILGRNMTVNFGTKIGNNTKVMDLTHITGNAVLEDDVFVGPGVSSADDNSMGRAADYDGMHDKGATIKKGASIGEGAVLLPGVVIGEKAVIAAGAVVTKDIPEGVIAMGCPAKVRNNQ